MTRITFKKDGSRYTVAWPTVPRIGERVSVMSETGRDFSGRVSDVAWSGAGEACLTIE